MKRIKAINGYTIYQATTKRDEENYNCAVGNYNVYFSSDIKDYGISNSYAEFEDVDTLETAEEYCGGNYAIAKEYVESKTTAASFEEIAEIEKKLDNGMTIEEIEEEEENEEEDSYIIEEVKNELQSIKIPSYVGKWSAFEKCIIENREFYIMEHDYYGDMTQYLVIECKYIKDMLCFFNVFETYDDIVTCLQDEEII